MNKYHIITLILCLFCLGGAATASPDRTAAAPDTQARSSQLKVSGIIKDDAGSPLIGVTIVVKGTSSGSVSNSDGSYTITVPYAEATLMVSYIGYAPQEINVNNRTRIDITMVEDSKALEEVVVVGYNVQKKETITGSISTITTKDLKQSPTANINNALAGRMPGLLVNQFNGGEPGNDAAQLNIRGKSTYGKSDVIMIANIDRKTGEIKLVSVYRDTYLNINDKNVYNKINAAYAEGGPQQAIKAINKNLDLNITQYVTFNWKAVATGINILGGVDIEISKAEHYYINAFITETVKGTGIGSVQIKKPGMHHMDGVQAVAYGRLRLMDSDYARTERQRLVIQKAFEKAVKSDLTTLNSLATWRPCARRILRPMTFSPW